MVADVQGQASLTLVEEKSLMWISTEFCVYSAQSQASIPLVQQGSMCQAIPLPEISAQDNAILLFLENGSGLGTILFRDKRQNLCPLSNLAKHNSNGKKPSQS